MCGIAGIIAPVSIEEKGHRIQAMMQSIIHRGPDDGQFHVDKDIAFGFRRLAIIDLETGAQPMATPDKKIWLVFN